MKRIFAINKCHTLNDVAYCSKRIKEYSEANGIPSENITVMTIRAADYTQAQGTLKKLLEHSQTLYYGAGQAFYVYHDIHHIGNTAIVLLLDERTTAEVVRAITHKPDFEVIEKGIQLFTQREPCLCEYSGDL